MYLKFAEGKTLFLHSTGHMVHKQSKMFYETLYKALLDHAGFQSSKRNPKDKLP